MKRLDVVVSMTIDADDDWDGDKVDAEVKIMLLGLVPRVHAVHQTDVVYDHGTIRS